VRLAKFEQEVVVRLCVFAVAGVVSLLGVAGANAERGLAIPRTGAYRLGSSGVLPGLQLAAPQGWAIAENTVADLNLAAPHRNESLAVALDVRAVKSSGHGHGTTVLRNVGRSPRSLVTWLTSDRDFQIVSKPAATSIGNQINATTIAVGVSRTAKYGDPGCPANPRCADLFRNPATWPQGAWFGIVGKEQVRLYLATIKRNGSKHTLAFTLDAPSHAQLLRLSKAAKGILRSIRLPHRVTSA
jgi:hypothetical protein